MVINFGRKGGRRGGGSYEEADCNIISIVFSSGRVQHFFVCNDACKNIPINVSQ